MTGRTRLAPMCPTGLFQWVGLLAASACVTLATQRAHADLSSTKPVRIGASSGPGKTSAFGANGMDCGIPWIDGLGRTQVIFGDTSSATNRLCGPDKTPPPDPNWPYATHRISVSGAVAWSTDSWLSDGISYNDMLREGAHFSPAILNTGHTVPSGAASIGPLDLVHFASTSLSDGTDGFSCAPGTLGVSAGFIGVRTSSPDGQNKFTRNDAFGTWAPDSNFAQGSLVKHGNHIYMFGITAGRNGGIKLARAAITEPLNGLSWQYWSGVTWSPDEAAAAFIVPPPVGELSAAYNQALDRFIIAHLDDQTGSIVYRDARTPEGPWSEQKTLVKPSESPALYGSYIYPFHNTGDPTALFFNMSNWQKSGGTDECLHSTLYNTSLYRSSLTYKNTTSSTSSGAIVTDAGFDRYLCTPSITNNCGTAEYSKPLSVRGGRWLPIPLVAAPCPGCALETNPEVSVARSYLGAPAQVQLTGNSGWRGIAQRVAVRPWSKYIIRMTGNWSSADAYIGAHAIPGVNFVSAGSTCGGVTWPTEPLAQQYLGSSGSGSSTLVVYTGGNSLVELFGGYVGTGSSGWMHIDTLDMTPADVVSDGGFEMQDVPLSDVQAPYLTEGPGSKHVGEWGMPGRAVELADESQGAWNAVTQLVTVRPGTYRLHANIASSGNFSVGYMGVRTTSGAILAETSYPDDPFYNEREVYVTIGGTAEVQVRLFVGYWSGFNAAHWSNIVADNIGLEEATF